MGYREDDSGVHLLESSSLKVLLVEDEPSHAEIMHHYFEELNGSKVEIHWKQSLKETIEALRESNDFSVILLDLVLPDSTMSKTVPCIAKYAGLTPIVVLSSLVDEEHALKTISQGAQDYLIKSQLSSQVLLKTISYARLRQKYSLLAAEAEVSQKLSAIIEYSNDAIIGLDLSGKILSWNYGAEVIFDYQADEVMAKPFADLTAVNPRDLEEVYKHVKNGSSIRHFEVIGKTKQSKLVDISLTISPILQKEKIVGFSVIARDISQKKQAEAAIRRNEAKFRRLYEANIIAILFTDFRGRVVEANDTFLRLTGYSREDLPIQEISMLSPNDEDLTMGLLEEIRQEGACSPREVQYVTKDGRKFPVMWGGALLKEDDRILSFAVDLLHQKKFEEALKKINKKLQMNNRELEQFAYITSHDLQEPLRNISLILDMLKEDLGENLQEEGRRFLDLAIDSALRLQGMIKEILNFSRIQVIDDRMKHVALEEIVKFAMQNLTKKIELSGTRVDYDELPRVWGDGQLLVQLFQNLLDNAIKYCQDGQTPKVCITSCRKEGAWQIAVQDNGVGISEKHYEKVFLLFQRLQSRSVSEGVGIGLSLCKRIVEKHGGSIWVESKVGQGSIFYFTLPDT